MASNKVLFTSHVANFQKFNRPFIEMFKKRGWEVHYASMGEEQVDGVDRAFVVSFDRSPFSFKNVKAIFALKRIIDTEQYDIIHTHTPMGSVVTRLAAIAARKKGTRVLYTAHGFHFFKGAPLSHWLIYYPIEKLLAHFTDTLITINEEDYNIASKKFKSNVYLVPGVGVDTKKFRPKKQRSKNTDAVRASLSLGPNDFVMIYVAELSKRKNQLWLIEVLAHFLKQHENTHLILAGKDSLEGKCEQLTDFLGITQQVHLLGYRNDISELMSISDVAVSASKQEGLPVNIMEALFIGLPVVATDCRGNRDLVSDGESGYIVAQGDSAAFMDKIKKLFIDEQERTRISTSDRTYLIEYDLIHVRQKMEALYE